LKLLQEEMNELKGEIQDLKEDQMKLPVGQYKVLPELITDEIEELEGELNDIQEKYNDLSSMPSIAE